MSNDEMMNATMEWYKRTASKYLDSDDELKRFLGATGRMLAEVTTQLWSQEELDKQIDARQESRCRSCPNTVYIQTLKETGLLPAGGCQGAPGAELGVQAPGIPAKAGRGKDALMLAAAANMRTLIIVGGVVVTLLGLSIIFTRQITEAAGFVSTSAQAANGGSKQ